jgi:hypothetical protein
MPFPFCMLDSTTVASITRFLDYDELVDFDESFYRCPWNMQVIPRYRREAWRYMIHPYLVESWLQMDRYLVTLIRQTYLGGLPEYLEALTPGDFRCCHMHQYLCEIEDDDMFGINGPDEFWWLQMMCHWMQRDFRQEKIEPQQNMAQYELEKERKKIELQHLLAQNQIKKEQELQWLSSWDEDTTQKKDSKGTIGIYPVQDEQAIGWDLLLAGEPPLSAEADVVMTKEAGKMKATRGNPIECSNARTCPNKCQGNCSKRVKTEK